MTEELVIFALRIGILLLLYLFLGQIAILILKDLRSSVAPQVVSAPQGRLVVVEGNVVGLAVGDFIPLDTLNSLGRAPGNAIRLSDDFVSGQHAVLNYRQKSWWIEDLGSTNGTTVNGKPVNKPTKVVPGDVIQIGVSKLRLAAK